jgi:N-acylneuraminate cytidylyltransferase
LEQQGTDVTYTCCLYATAPFITATNLVESYEALAASDKVYSVAVTEFEYPPQRGFTVEKGFPQLIMPEHQDTRSQDLPTVYHDAGQFYWTKVTPDWVDESMLSSPKTLPYSLPRYQVQDIDTPDDWIRAEAMFMALKSMKKV